MPPVPRTVAGAASLRAISPPRSSAAQLSIAIALSMVIGAFVASAAAALGGSIRDEYQVHRTHLQIEAVQRWSAVRAPAYLRTAEWVGRQRLRQPNAPARGDGFLGQEKPRR